MALKDKIRIWVSRFNTHHREFMKYVTFKKVINLIKVEYCFLRKKGFVTGYPYMLGIEVANFCNLRCPLCPTGRLEYGRKHGVRCLRFQRVVGQAE